MPPPIRNLPRIQRALLDWHAREGMHAPWRESADPYHALVAAVMAQQTQMARVLPSYERFVAAFPSIEALAAATAGDVIRVWAGMGYNQRAVRLHRAARTIREHGWPADAAGLARIDGIGPFTAAIIASFAWGHPAACVDTNVVRVLSRLAGGETRSGRRTQDLADACMTGAAAAAPARWNQALMDYGARVCAARPRCGECVIRRSCATYAAGGPAAVAGARLVADTRTAYAANARFEHTPRYFRGRIVDALRALPPGRGLSIDQLVSRIANEVTPSTTEVSGWVDALVKAGLAERRGARVRLPP